jgi:hypothetical protein
MDIQDKLQAWSTPNQHSMINFTSGERKKLEDELDETNKKISGVFQKMRKKTSSNQHNADDVLQVLISPTF